METLQITGISAEEFQAILTRTVEEATTKAVEKALKQKEDLNSDITVAEIAVLLKCSTMTVFRKLNEHKIPRYRLGRETAIKRKYLETIKKPIPKEK